MHSTHGCSPVSSGHWETSEALTSTSLPSTSLGDGISLHARSHKATSVHAEPLIRSRPLGGRALSSMCGVACFVSCCHRTAAANGLFSMSLSWLRGRFSLVFDPPARLRFPCVVFPPAHVYY